MRALLATAGHVADLLAFGQGLEAVAGDFGEVSEQIVTACVRSDEAKALSVVEPFNGTGLHIIFLKDKNYALHIMCTAKTQKSRREYEPEVPTGGNCN